jgi:type 2 lantibiotic biosynthesis protein LanM
MSIAPQVTVPAWLADVARRAASLDERLAAGGLGDPEGLARWERAIAPDDPAFFARRLAWDGLDPSRLVGDTDPPLPSWAPWLAAGLACEPGPPPALEIPFIHAVWPLACAAAPPALAGALAERLGEIAAPALYDAFERGGRRYEALIGTWPRYLQAWPVLARLLGTAMEQFAAGAAELVERYQADRPALAAMLGRDPGELADARPASTDAHAGGRVVWRLDGNGLVYKPRSLALEAAFATVGVLDRGTYGWMELVRPRPCEDPAAVDRFFHQAGRHLALFHALGGTDFHAENVLAAGDRPVVVDLEGLLQPAVEPDELGWADPAAVMRRVDQGALASLYVSFWSRLPDGSLVDGGGLARGPEVLEERCWLELNTDAMRPGTRQVRPAAPHLPTLAGRPVPATERAAAVRAGFREAYRELVATRGAVLERPGLADARVRFFFRTTRHYEQLDKRLREPAALVDGLERSFRLDRLARTYRAWGERPPLWDLIGAERRSLEAMDVPAFTLPAGGTGPGFTASPLARATARLQALGELDLEVQDQAIAIALAPGELLPPGQAAAPEPPLASALALAERLARRAIPTADGAVTWLAPVPSAAAGRPVPGALATGLWEGAVGPALFLAAAAAAGGPDRWAELARASLVPLSAAVAAGAPRWARDAGGLASWAGSARALAVLARLLEAPELRSQAVAILAGLPVGAIATCGRPDASGGLADVLLSALALADDPVGLGLARLVGDRLLALGEGGWRTETEQGAVLAGFAHGQAGVATALIGLYEATGEAAYRDAALASLAHEDALFDPERRNWPIVGTADAEGRPWAWAAWCHGAAGIAISRLAAGRHDPRRLAEAELAIETLLGTPDHPLDWLCCGNFGRVEALLLAGRALDRPAWIEQASALAVRRHAVAAFGQDPPRRELDLDPSFLRGLAGIGYTTLRLALPDTLPGLMGGT